MIDHTQASKTISLENYGIKNAKVQYQLSSEQLHKLTIEKGQGVEAASGALAVNTGEFTGRSPKDRFIVKDAVTQDRVWWGNINIPFESDAYEKLYNKVTGNDYVYLGGEFHPDIKMVHFTHSTNKPHDWEDYASFV